MHIVTINRETVMLARFDLRFAEMKGWAMEQVPSCVLHRYESH